MTGSAGTENDALWIEAIKKNNPMEEKMKRSA
jgi:hypothetical protein